MLISGPDTLVHFLEVITSGNTLKDTQSRLKMFSSQATNLGFKVINVIM